MLRIVGGLLAASVWLASGSAFAAGKVVINEVFVNPPGDDDNKEWIELYNAGDAAMLIGGYTIESQSNAAAVLVATVVADTVLPAGAYYVIGGTQVAGAQQTDLRVNVGGTLLNVSTYGAALRLRNSSSQIIDTLVYGANNDNLLLDDTGAVAASIAPVPVTFATLSRIPNGVDTQQSGADFKNVSATLGVANVDEVPNPPDGGAPDGGGSSSSGGSSGATSSSSGGSSSGESSSSGGGSSGQASSSGGGSSGETSSSSGGSSSSSGGKSSSSGGRSSSSGGKSSGDDGDDDDDSSGSSEDGGCSTTPGGSLSAAALFGVAAMALRRRRRPR